MVYNCICSLLQVKTPPIWLVSIVDRRSSPLQKDSNDMLIVLLNYQYCYLCNIVAPVNASEYSGFRFSKHHQDTAFCTVCYHDKVCSKYVLFYLTENSSVFDVRFETVDLAITADLMDPNSAEFQRRQTLFCNDVSGDISIRTRHK